MPLIIAFAGDAGFLRLLMVYAFKSHPRHIPFAVHPAYTEIVGLKATDPAWKPENNQRICAHLAITALFLRPNVTSMAGRLGQPRGWPVPDCRSFHTPADPPPLLWKEQWRFLTLNQEPVMSANVLSFFVTAEARAIARATLSTYLDSTAPSFRHELADRLSLITESLEHLESITCEAAFREADLPLQSLYSVIRLITRESRMIGALFEAMYEERKGGRS